ncbi:MAG TPA: CBS domain-containing protein [Vicinamibacterales bacterium]
MKEKGVAMKVKDLQTSNVHACSPDTNLAAAAQIMWDCDCGAVPVVSEDRTLLGMITDRDICIATTTRSVAPADIQVRHVMSTGNVYSCRPEDDARTALATMGTHRVRRLPVVDRENKLVGILSINDLARHAEHRAGAGVPGDEFIEAFQSISNPTHAHAHA